MDFDIAVVIPVFNEENNVDSTLDNFASQSDKKTLFVVVDNNSTDDTVSKIKIWQAKNRKINLDLISEKQRGVMYAKHKGLSHASKLASSLISVDADVLPPKNFFSDFRRHFLSDPKADIWRGRIQQNTLTRLQRALFLPRLLDLFNWQEKIETLYFGPFFFGGYFGIKSRKFSDLAFKFNDTSFSEEPIIFWSHRCYYLGYKFILSTNYMRVSDRRFWGDPYGFVAGERRKAIREISKKNEEKLEILKHLKQNEKKLMDVRFDYFGKKILLLILDALIYLNEYNNSKKRAKKALENISRYLKININEIPKVSKLDITAARGKILEKYHPIVTMRLKNKYQTVVSSKELV